MTNVDSEQRVINNVSDTAWLVATLRAQESQRSDALFKDPYAKILVGDKGTHMVEKLVGSYDFSWFMAVRTIVIDKMISYAIENYAIDCVVNLACGLCARPYRLEFPKKISWVDVDFDDVIQYKRSKLEKEKPHCDLEYFSCDLRETTERERLWKNLNSRSQNILVITEGLLLYLKEENVQDLARDLKSISGVKLWITDLYRGAGGKTTKWYNYMEASNAAFRWYCADYKSFFEQFDWKSIDERDLLKEAVYYKRLPSQVVPESFKNSPVFDEDFDAMWEKSGIWMMQKI